MDEREIELGGSTSTGHQQWRFGDFCGEYFSGVYYNFFMMHASMAEQGRERRVQSTAVPKKLV